MRKPPIIKINVKDGIYGKWLKILEIAQQTGYNGAKIHKLLFNLQFHMAMVKTGPSYKFQHKKIDLLPSTWLIILPNTDHKTTIDDVW